MKQIFGKGVIPKIEIMNVKRIFGTILTLLGIVGLIYVGTAYVNRSIFTRELIVTGIISVLFFFAGIGLVRNTKDEG
ncbi:hypothetical protein D9M68_637280 [compost metagenome]